MSVLICLAAFVRTAADDVRICYKNDPSSDGISSMQDALEPKISKVGVLAVFYSAIWV